MSGHFPRHSLESADDSSNGLWVLDAPVVVSNPVCGLFFAGAAQLADKDNGLCVVVRLKYLQCVDKVCARNHVATHADTQALADARARQ
jgi:hypothetical protein